MHQESTVARSFFLLTGIVLIFQSCNLSNEKNRSNTTNEAKDEQVKADSKKVTADTAYIEGQALYAEHCMICHQTDGSGVSGLNPPLIATEYVVGDKDRLLGIVLNGSNVGLEVNGSTYSNAMPSFRALSDMEIAHISSYIRNSFGNTATPVTEEEVMTYRDKNEK
ncbi:c-type cytochrome [Pareuzebyella sediminis]|uniref:c-type cytochrome n=1 Tax=Pareuzebyella sediminis TaxID=2607998 RepID=UPI0011EE2856|nr:cytochrome c [Pareuzebyella sediminis]